MLFLLLHRYTSLPLHFTSPSLLYLGLECPDGQFQELTVAIEYKCKYCEKGKKYLDKVTECTTCPAGEWQNSDNTDAPVCTECVSGLYLVDAATTPAAHDNIEKCLYCSAGLYFINQVSVCSNCLDGQYQHENALATAICNTCSAGQYAPAKENACGNCEPGKFQELSSSIEYNCKFCEKGKQFTNTLAECSICVSGQYQNQSNAFAAACYKCKVGRFLTDNKLVVTNHDDEVDCKFEIYQF
mgnify:CR=1 FL=1